MVVRRAAQAELRRRRLQRRHHHHVPAGVLDGARAVPGPLRLPRHDDGRHRAAPHHGAARAHQVPRLRQEDRRLPRPARRAAARPGDDLRAGERRLAGHALPRAREDPPQPRVQPARRHVAARHPLPRAQAAAVRLLGQQGARVGAGVRHPLHQGGGRAAGARGPAGGSEERHGAQDIRGQPVPHLAHPAAHLHPLPRPLRLAPQAGRGGRERHVPGVRPEHEGPAVRGAQRQQRGVEHGDGGHAVLQRQRHAQHQDRQLPHPPAEAAGLRRRLPRLEDLLPALRGDADDRRAAVGVALPLPGHQGLGHGLQSRLPRRHRERLAPARHHHAARHAAQLRAQGLHPRARHALHRPHQLDRAGEAARRRRRRPPGRRQRFPCRDHGVRGQVPGGRQTVRQGRRDGEGHRDVPRPASVGGRPHLRGEQRQHGRERPDQAPGQVGGGHGQQQAGRQPVHRVEAVRQGHRPVRRARLAGRVDGGGSQRAEGGQGDARQVRRAPAQARRAQVRAGGLSEDGRHPGPHEPAHRGAPLGRGVRACARARGPLRRRRLSAVRRVPRHHGQVRGGAGRLQEGRPP
mmetsp:Transcript_18053/g.63846  ORF Transcript_18053/g.63846 Transcript_18053/m.63846 type:complete len:575 (-) Transcript_18053:2582-4306(-)